MGSNFPIDKAWSYIVSVRDDRKTIFRNGLSIAWGKSNQQFTPIHFDCGKNPWSIAIGWGSLLVLSRSKMKYNEMKFCWEQWCLTECNWNQFQAIERGSLAIWSGTLSSRGRLWSDDLSVGLRGKRGASASDWLFLSSTTIANSLKSIYRVIVLHRRKAQ